MISIARCGWGRACTATVVRAGPVSTAKYSPYTSLYPSKSSIVTRNDVTSTTSASDCPTSARRAAMLSSTARVCTRMSSVDLAVRPDRGALDGAVRASCAGPRHEHQVADDPQMGIGAPRRRATGDDHRSPVGHARHDASSPNGSGRDSSLGGNRRVVRGRSRPDHRSIGDDTVSCRVDPAEREQASEELAARPSAAARTSSACSVDTEAGHPCWTLH